MDDDDMDDDGDIPTANSDVIKIELIGESNDPLSIILRENVILIIMVEVLLVLAIICFVNNNNNNTNL